MKTLPLLLLALVFSWLLHAADPTAAPTSTLMREIGPGIFQIGEIRFDRAQRTASFPGKVNLLEGNLEYLLVHTTGAAHESLLSTEIQPSDLHFVMLLLGAKGAGITTPAPDDAPPQINKEFLSHAPELKGDRIRIAVKWKAGDAEKSAPVEDWIFNQLTGKVAARGPWLYTGSMFRGEHFLAQKEGAFAALVRYPAALINNPRKGSDDDTVWLPHKAAMPPLETPVEISITLESNASP